MRLVRMLLILVVTLPLWSCDGSGPNEPQPPEGGDFRFALSPGIQLLSDPVPTAMLTLFSVRIFDEPTRIVTSSNYSDHELHIAIHGVETAVEGHAPGDPASTYIELWPGDLDDGKYTLVFDYRGNRLDYELEIAYPLARILGDTHYGQFIQPTEFEFYLKSMIIWEERDGGNPLEQYAPVTP
jgi:hypothetical protein